MKKIISLIIVLVLFASLSIFLVACGNDAVPVPDSIEDPNEPGEPDEPEDPLEGGWEGKPYPIPPVK